ncbi:MAG TPA: hypothetical protein DCE18_00905 [Syntrophobacteraceae bacterium]|nr:hypothetical protein [Syntrophobacteraceae bacterium]
MHPDRSVLFRPGDHSRQSRRCSLHASRPTGRDSQPHSDDHCSTDFDLIFYTVDNTDAFIIGYSFTNTHAITHPHRDTHSDADQNGDNRDNPNSNDDSHTHQDGNQHFNWDSDRNNHHYSFSHSQQN